MRDYNDKHIQLKLKTLNKFKSYEGIYLIKNKFNQKLLTKKENLMLFCKIFKIKQCLNLENLFNFQISQVKLKKLNPKTMRKK